MKAFVTGGAGFIGSNLVPRLLAAGHEVTAYDDLSLGRREWLAPHVGDPRFRFVVGDLLDEHTLERSVAGHDMVFHLAANSDIRFHADTMDTDLRQGTLVTFGLLEAMRRTGVRAIVFASTSAVYGEARQMPTPESYGPLLPISLYGASKVACEGLLGAFAHLAGFVVWIYRFANVVGRNGTHGVVVDFIQKLRRDPTCLEILGDGRQAKPYLFVDDCIDGILFGVDHARHQVNVYNLGCPGATEVKRIADMVVEAMGLRDVCYRFTGESRGWPGDVTQVRLDTSALTALGWAPRHSSDGAVARAIQELLRQC